jgi:hypothetical protein
MKGSTVRRLRADRSYKGIVAPPPRERNPRKRSWGIPASLAGGRCSRAAMAAAPGRSGSLSQQLAARRSTEMRGLDMRLRMG